MDGPIKFTWISRKRTTCTLPRLSCQTITCSEQHQKITGVVEQGLDFANDEKIHSLSKPPRKWKEFFVKSPFARFCFSFFGGNVSNLRKITTSSSKLGMISRNPKFQTKWRGKELWEVLVLWKKIIFGRTNSNSKSSAKIARQNYEIPLCFTYVTTVNRTLLFLRKWLLRGQRKILGRRNGPNGKKRRQQDRSFSVVLWIVTSVTKLIFVLATKLQFLVPSMQENF